MVCHTGLLTACKLSANLYVLLCVQWKTPDDGQRNCLKHVEFYSKTKFEKLVHLVGFIIGIYHDAWLPECQKMKWECYHLTVSQTVTTEQFALHIRRSGTINLWTLNKQNSVNVSPGNIWVCLMPDTDRHLILIQQYLEVWKHNTVFNLIKTA